MGKALVARSRGATPAAAALAATVAVYLLLRAAGVAFPLPPVSAWVGGEEAPFAIVPEPAAARAATPGVAAFERVHPPRRVGKPRPQVGTEASNDLLLGDPRAQHSEPSRRVEPTAQRPVRARRDGGEGGRRTIVPIEDPAPNPTVFVPDVPDMTAPTVPETTELLPDVEEPALAPGRSLPGLELPAL